MVPNEQETTPPPPPCTPTARIYDVGDLVHVFQGTASYVRGRNPVAFIGRVVGSYDADAKWEVLP